VEIAKKELDAIENTLAGKIEQQVQELCELELVLVGGGNGDVIFG